MTFKLARPNGAWRGTKKDYSMRRPNTLATRIMPVSTVGRLGVVKNTIRSLYFLADGVCSWWA